METARSYQRRGLLETPERLDGMGRGIVVQRYGEQDVHRLRFFRSAQAVGFTLEQIAELKAVRDALSRLAWTCDDGSGATV